jgi:hypothetical protein
MTRERADPPQRHVSDLMRSVCCLLQSGDRTLRQLRVPLRQRCEQHREGAHELSRDCRDLDLEQDVCVAIL